MHTIIALTALYSNTKKGKLHVNYEFASFLKSTILKGFPVDTNRVFHGIRQYATIGHKKYSALLLVSLEKSNLIINALMQNLTKLSVRFLVAAHSYSAVIQNEI